MRKEKARLKNQAVDKESEKREGEKGKRKERKTWRRVRENKWQRKQINTTHVCTVQGLRIRTVPGHQKPSFLSKTIMNRI
ncbi:hypothetical protein PITC_097820 [Penicillium italicum]|uniref:Uncharacterized protein n=1 Tax=Penicillium italicum TaxID=40296 RepID=A0A0A2L4M6_PENIT|nr:hypothetical protein PITC_097820 [Penicillium italicum]